MAKPNLWMPNIWAAAGLALCLSILVEPALAQSETKAYKPFMSDSGKQIVQKYIAKRNADMEPLLRKKRTLQDRFDGLLTAKTYDDAKLVAVMAEMRVLEGQIFDTMGSSMLAILKALPDYDREVFMQSISKIPPSGSAKPGY